MRIPQLYSSALYLHVFTSTYQTTANYSKLKQSTANYSKLQGLEVYEIIDHMIARTSRADHKHNWTFINDVGSSTSGSSYEWDLSTIHLWLTFVTTSINYRWQKSHMNKTHHKLADVEHLVSRCREERRPTTVGTCIHNEDWLNRVPARGVSC